MLGKYVKLALFRVVWAGIEKLQQPGYDAYDRYSWR